MSEQNIFLLLLQIFLLLGCAKLLGEAFNRLKQPALTAEIIVGIVMGPTILGRFFPAAHQFLFPSDVIQQNMFETLSWLGVFFLLLETGLEFDFSNAWRQRGDALKIALADIIIPLSLCFLICLLLPDYYLVDTNRRIIFSIFLATVMTISAMPVTARALHDLKLSKTDLGFLIMSALSVNDIIGWLIFAIVLGIFTQVNLSISGILGIFSFTIGFTVFCLTVGRYLANRVVMRIQSEKMAEPATSLTFIFLLGFFSGAVSQKMGIHALFGFFLAGIMAGEARSLPERTRQIISQMVYALFVPLFFVGIGLKVDFLLHFDLFLVGMITIAGITARFVGAYVGVNLTRTERTNHLPVAIAHIPGGVMEIVIAMLALKYGLITPSVFVAIVFSAVVSAALLGPLLGFAIRRRKRVSILEFFPRRAVIPDLATAQRDIAVRKLCEFACDHAELVDVDSVSAAVMQRELAQGTAMEEGIAVPHARLDFLNHPVIVFGRSLTGIEWNSPDGKPVNSVFLILTPTQDDVQVQILAWLARALSAKEVRDEIRDAPDGQAIWQVLHDVLSVQGVIKRK